MQAKPPSGPAAPSPLPPLLAMVVLAHLVFSGCRVALTLYAIALQASTLVVGLQVSLLSLLPMLFSVRLGRWLDRVGLRRTAALALAMLLTGT